jgi:hypothetical protein
MEPPTSPPPDSAVDADGDDKNDNDSTCWVYFSEILPLPIRGKQRCAGNRTSVSGDVCRAMREHQLVSLGLMPDGGKPYFVDVNPQHIVAVAPWQR